MGQGAGASALAILLPGTRPGEVAQRRVGLVGVVLGSPGLDDEAGVLLDVEQLVRAPGR